MPEQRKPVEEADRELLARFQDEAEGLREDLKAAQAALKPRSAGEPAHGGGNGNGNALALKWVLGIASALLVAIIVAFAATISNHQDQLTALQEWRSSTDGNRFTNTDGRLLRSELMRLMDQQARSP